MTAATSRMPWRVRASFVVIASVVRPVIALLTDRRYVGFEHFPRGQGCIVCANHITEIDPFVVGHALYVNGILPHFLAKDALFRHPLMGFGMRAIGQIPVERGGASSKHSLYDARRVLDYGGAIVIYPEGTLTRDPDHWPMRGRSGAARLALETGAPVVPIAQWGAHEVLHPYGRRLYLRPRKTLHVRVGAPLDLSAYAGKRIEREVLDSATRDIQMATTSLLSEIRGLPAPADLYDPSPSDR